MAVSRVCYATRESVMTAQDYSTTSIRVAQVDRAIESASESVDSLCKRKFFPEDKTCSWDWPNYSASPPWRLWFDQNELADVTVNIPVVTAAGVVIPNSDILWGHPNASPPYRYMELRRDRNSVFSGSATPQRSVTIAGTYGYWLKTVSAGMLTSAIADTTSTTVSLSDSHLVGVGDAIVIDTERLLITDRRYVDTTIAFTGLTTASAADNILAVPDGTKFTIGETLRLDSERLYVNDIIANNLLLKRAWDGSLLAAHTSGTIYAARQLVVKRGSLGTVAAAHNNSALINRLVPPSLARDLAVAESINTVEQETSGYARTVGGGDNMRPAPGQGLYDIRCRAQTSIGRSLRSRVV